MTGIGKYPEPFFCRNPPGEVFHTFDLILSRNQLHEAEPEALIFHGFRQAPGPVPPPSNDKNPKYPNSRSFPAYSGSPRSAFRSGKFSSLIVLFVTGFAWDSHHE